MKESHSSSSVKGSWLSPRLHLRCIELESRVVPSGGFVDAEIAPATIANFDIVELAEPEVRSPKINFDRVSSDLLTAYARSLPPDQASSLPADMVQGDGASILPLLYDPAGRVGVNITSIAPRQLVPYLESLGVVVVATLDQYYRLEAYMPFSALPAVSQLGDQGLLGIDAVYRPKLRTGTVNSQADNILETDRVRTSIPSYTGTGVKIGVLSDSYNKYSTSPASASISSGNLPSNVQVLQDYTSAATDEGRAMLELIYDLAPGAGLGFATADISESGFANNIRALANAGYGVIVDDVAYYDEPYFQDGIVAQAVNDVVTGGAAYFSAAGNEGNISYDSGATTAYGTNALNFVSQTISAISGSASSYYDWNSGSGVDTQMAVTIPRGSSITENFEWDQPYYTTNGVTTNLDFYLISTNTSTGVQTIRASSTTNNVTNQIPQSLFSYTNNLSASTNAVTTFSLVVRNTNGGPVPGRIKFIDEVGDSAVVYPEYFTNSSTIVGHAAAAGASAVGAAPFFQQNTPETYSSTGPSTFLFNTDGSRKATAEVRAKPDVLSIDGTDTSFFYPNSDFEGNGFNNFFGTSAAAPHAAAVAALIRQANPTWTPAQVYAQLKATADPTAGNGDPNVIGAGLIDAYRAIFGGPVAAALPTIDGFESGNLATDWQVYKQGSGLTSVVSTNSPATGTYQLVMGGDIGYGSSGLSYPGLNEAILHVNLSSQSDVQLTFDEKKFSGEVDNTMPATFTGHGNYDGVSLSVDGTNWFRIVSLTGTSSTTVFQTQTFNLSTIAANLALTLTSDTQVKFQQYGASSYAVGTRGIAFDNVRVKPLTTVASVVVNDGSAQRSMVQKLVVTLNGNVPAANLAAGAFTVTQLTGTTATFNASVFSVTFLNGQTIIELRFDGASVIAGSLYDGRYRLTIDGSKITDSAGDKIDASGANAPGTSTSRDFFRLFGDSDGDGDVDNADLLQFRLSFGQPTTSTFYNSAFDYDGDGDVDNGDLLQFRIRFNVVFP